MLTQDKVYDIAELISDREFEKLNGFLTKTGLMGFSPTQLYPYTIDDLVNVLTVRYSEMSFYADDKQRAQQRFEALQFSQAAMYGFTPNEEFYSTVALKRMFHDAWVLSLIPLMTSAYHGVPAENLLCATFAALDDLYDMAKIGWFKFIQGRNGMGGYDIGRGEATLIAKAFSAHGAMYDPTGVENLNLLIKSGTVTVEQAIEAVRQVVSSIHNGTAMVEHMPRNVSLGLLIETAEASGDTRAVRSACDELVKLDDVPANARHWANIALGRLTKEALRLK